MNDVTRSPAPVHVRFPSGRHRHSLMGIPIVPSYVPAITALTARPLALWKQLRDDLVQIACEHPDAILASSLAAEDMVVFHAMSIYTPELQTLTLDTGRLHTETVQMAATIRQHYQRDILFFRPDPDRVQAHVQQHGAHAFYDSVELRKECCQIRKVEPLRRALTGRSAWITGQRREQSASRNELALSEYDATFGLQKFNPLTAWTHDDVWAVIRGLGIPYNPLHDQGYPSIGCEPCTRAIRPSEDVRAGRWWWEQRDSLECGLHAGNLHSSVNT